MKKVEGFSRYGVCEDGSIYSLLSGKCLLSHIRHGSKYRIVSIANDLGERKKMSVHRMVALAYLPNPENKPQVNHIDGNPSNNHVSNLEWCTAQENTDHAWRIGLCKRIVIPDDVCNLIKSDYCSNIPVSVLSSKYGYSSSVIARVLSLAGVYEECRVYCKADHSDVVRDFIGGELTVKEIASKYGYTTTMVNKIARDNGCGSPTFYRNNYIKSICFALSDVPVVADRFNLSHSFVRRLCGFKLPPVEITYVITDLDRFKRLVDSRLSREELCREFGCGDTAISTALRRTKCKIKAKVKYSDEFVNELRDSGKSSYEIARELGISQPSAYKLLKRKST